MLAGVARSLALALLALGLALLGLAVVVALALGVALALLVLVLVAALALAVVAAVLEQRGRGDADVRALAGDVLLVGGVLVEGDVGRGDEALVVRAPHVVLARAVGDAGEEADLGLGVQLAPLALVDVHVGEAAEDADVAEVGLLAVPRLVRRLAVQGACGGAVLDPRRRLHGLAPVLVGQLRVLEHAARHLHERAVGALSLAVLVRAVRVGLLPLDVGLAQHVLEVLADVLAAAVGAQVLDLLVLVRDAVEEGL